MPKACQACNGYKIGDRDVCVIITDITHHIEASERLKQKWWQKISSIILIIPELRGCKARKTHARLR
jgi:hypothetical protein